MLRTVSLALKTLPLWSLAGVLLCIFYVAGFFSYPGRDWLSFLEIGDYVAIALPIVPVIIFFFIGNFAAARHRDHKRQEFIEYSQAQDAKELSKPPEERRWNKPKPDKKLERWAAGASALTAWGYYQATSALIPPLAVLSFALSIGATLILVALHFWFSWYRDWIVSGVAIAAFLVMSLAYSAGQYASSRRYVDPPDYELVLDSAERLCVNVVVLTKRGPIFTRDHRTTEFVEWSEVRAIRRHTTCEGQPPSNA